MNPSPRTVKPRQTSYTHLPIIAVTPSRILLVEEGELLSNRDLENVVRTYRKSLFVARDCAGIARRLHGHFKDHPQWQMRVSPYETEFMDSDGEIRKYSNTRVAFFGWQRVSNTRGRPENRYHTCLDPNILLGLAANKMFTPENELDLLVKLASDVQEFCREHDLKLASSKGGLAVQFLKDSRFYPKPRRKVPQATNDRIRPHLPGNFYSIYAPGWEPTGTYPHAYYMDQSQAHHNAARELQLPDSNYFHARGHWRQLTEARPWLYPASRGFTRLVERHKGMLAIVTHIKAEYYGIAPPWLTQPEQHCLRKLDTDTYLLCIFSNELTWLRNDQLQYIVAAWSSPIPDTGLARYARWAKQEIQSATSFRAKWLKPTLLSTYGVLASSPRRLQYAYAKSKTGKLSTVRSGPATMQLYVHGTTKKREPGITHVCQRAMIEADTRNHSIVKARSLQRQGYVILNIYVDAVFCYSYRRGPPTVMEPWRSKGTLTNYRILNPTSWRSDQTERLPGIPHSQREARRDARRPFLNLSHGRTPTC